MNLPELLKIAEAATKGPWHGDRVDGSVKYHLLGHANEVVIAGDNANSETGPYGIMHDRDEAFFLAFNPTVAIELIARLERAEKDAEKYRWLRDKANDSYRSAPIVCIHALDREHTTMVHGKNLDDILECAMGKHAAMNGGKE